MEENDPGATGRSPVEIDADDQPTAEVPVEEIPDAAAPDVEPTDDAVVSWMDPEAGDLAGGASILDDFTNEDYLSATTTEYQGLAESVRKAATETHELQAVAAAMPGVDAGLVGFEDVTGEVSRVAEEPSASWLSGDLPARIGSALVLVALLFGSLWAGGGWFVALVSVVSVLALGEFYSSIRRVGYVPVALFGLLGAVAVMISAWVAGPGGIAGALTVFTMVILLWFSVLVRRNPLENATLTIFGLIWIAGLLGYAAALARFDSFRPLIIALVLVAAFFDIGSYFIGRSMGRRPLAPTLSPKKTVEGLVGGALVAVAVAVLMSFLSWFDPITLNGSLLLAAGVIAVAPLGDLAESMIKRSLGIKDMGSLLPGHGGLLDRIDALLFAVPVGYLIYQALGYLG